MREETNEVVGNVVFYACAIGAVSFILSQFLVITVISLLTTSVGIYASGGTVEELKSCFETIRSKFVGGVKFVLRKIDDLFFAKSDDDSDSGDENQS